MTQHRRWPTLLYWMVFTLAGVAAIAMWTHLLTTRGTQLLEALPAFAVAAVALAALLTSRRRWPRTARTIDTTLTVTVVAAATIMLVRSGLSAFTLIMCCVATLNVALEARAQLERRSERKEATKQANASA